MADLKGEIIIAPKTVYWVEMPGVIGQKDKFSLLTQDILLIECDLENLEQLNKKDDENIVYIFNLDRIFRKRGANSIDRELRFSQEIIKFMQERPKNKALVHTSILHEDIKKKFESEKIYFLQKNLEYKQIALSTALKIVQFVFKGEQALRTQVRVNYYPENKINVDISNLTAKTPKVKALLKDISMNGVGLKILDGQDLRSFKVKDLVEMKAYFREATLKISVGFVTRLSPDDYELGLNFNLKNHKMITETDATTLSGIVYEAIKTVFKEL